MCPLSLAASPRISSPTEWKIMSRSKHRSRDLSRCSLEFAKKQQWRRRRRRLRGQNMRQTYRPRGFGWYRAREASAVLGYHRPRSVTRQSTTWRQVELSAERVEVPPDNVVDRRSDPCSYKLLIALHTAAAWTVPAHRSHKSSLTTTVRTTTGTHIVTKTLPRRATWRTLATLTRKFIVHASNALFLSPLSSCRCERRYSRASVRVEVKPELSTSCSPHVAPARRSSPWCSCHCRDVLRDTGLFVFAGWEVELRMRLYTGF